MSAAKNERGKVMEGKIKRKQERKIETAWGKHVFSHCVTGEKERKLMEHGVTLPTSFFPPLSPPNTSPSLLSFPSRSHLEEILEVFRKPGGTWR